MVNASRDVKAVQHVSKATVFNMMFLDVEQEWEPVDHQGVVIVNVFRIKVMK